MNQSEAFAQDSAQDRLETCISDAGLELSNLVRTNSTMENLSFILVGLILRNGVFILTRFCSFILTCHFFRFLLTRKTLLGYFGRLDYSPLRKVRGEVYFLEM
jgi:hypothetical protein